MHIYVYVHTYMYYSTHKVELELELAIYLELELHLEAQVQGEKTATKRANWFKKTEKWRMADDGESSSSSGARAGFCV